MEGFGRSSDQWVKQAPRASVGGQNGGCMSGFTPHGTAGLDPVIH